MLKISVGNGVWWGVLGGTAAGTLGLYLLLRECSLEQTRLVLFALGCLTLVLYVVQRLFMFRDEDFLKEYGSRWQDLLVQFLPLHMCYAGLILTLIGLWFDVQAFLAFSFNIGALGACFALITPDGYNQNKSLLLPHILLFYALHAMLVAVYCSVGLLGLLEPGWTAMLESVGIALAMAVVMHAVNVIGQRAGLNAMNYFYTMDPGGSGLLEMLWKWIPHRFFYIVVPALAAFAAWAAVLTVVMLMVR